MVELESRLLNSRILIVEDDESSLEMLTKFFEKKGYKNISGATTGKDAIKKSTASIKDNLPYDLLIVDLVLPDMDGHKVYKKFRETHPVPVIIITGKKTKEDQMEALAAGVDDYLLKPIDLDILSLKTERIITKQIFSQELINSHRRNQRLFLNLLSVMAKILEAKDFYTQFHSENVSRYARLLAEKRGFNKEQVEKIGIAGILHDFGKIGLKEGLLNKHGHLTEKEFDLVKQHPVIATTILEPIGDLKEIIRDIRYHHESYNGQGYPDGLKGEKIPIGARILAIADAFDAMTSRRTYHEPMNIDEARKEIQRCSGTQFDPKLVELFLDVIDEMEQHHEIA